jgi:transposase
MLKRTPPVAAAEANPPASSGLRIRSAGNRHRARAVQQHHPVKAGTVQDSSHDSSHDSSSSVFRQLTHFIGFDWAKDVHQATALDGRGAIVLDLEFEDSAQGWALLREKLGKLTGFAGFDRLGVCIETSRGPMVERLLEMGLAVYPVNPKAAERYRDRKRPSGAKSDPLDAWCFGDALRTDGHDWRQLRPVDPPTLELRLLCRDEIALIERRTALVNQLQSALQEYFPIMLRAFEDWTLPSSWRVLIAFPTPGSLAIAGKRKLEKTLRALQLNNPKTMQERLEMFAQSPSFANPNSAVIAAKSFLATNLAGQLLTLQGQLNQYRKRIEEKFNEHPDHDVFGSLPGAGKKLAPRLLGEIGQDRELYDTPDALCCYAGTAPVTRKSGTMRIVSFRRACNKTLRATLHLWANLSREQCAWAAVYYDRKKEQGMSHANALRCLAQRWIKILWQMWQDNARYDEARHTQNQLKHGSWVLQLLPESATD